MIPQEMSVASWASWSLYPSDYGPSGGHIYPGEQRSAPRHPQTRNRVTQ